jgi:hypothetical protein
MQYYISSILSLFFTVLYFSHLYIDLGLALTLHLVSNFWFLCVWIFVIIFKIISIFDVKKENSIIYKNQMYSFYIIIFTYVLVITGVLNGYGLSV